ncbi:snare protein TLG1/Syntaxin [Suillus clintonianus]|uniref:snare protein TLG1/Syntaxin n=1 Tax=Suillus clintonianus TaxID=1904413 RepID=UPI001B86C440|nr:snare protein TLG1/Syntaxin [Suillus clintonianus]KAG2142485.1 snare protein TLG1/Syntaxin [Suillus clintonianus]
MSTDPYHEVQQDIQSSLQTASTLRSSFLRIRSSAREGSEELVLARNELKATLATLDTDLEDLEESVKMVEETGPRYFGLDDAEVSERRKYVGRVRREIEGMRVDIEGRNLPSGGKSLSTPLQSQLSLPSGSRSTLPIPGSQSGEPDDEQAKWAHEEQQLLIQEQDRTMDSISGTLNTLAQQAGLMGHEIVEHVEMLDDLEANVDRTDSKLSDAMRRMKKFARDTEETKSGWCITILIIVLIALLLAVILV